MSKKMIPVVLSFAMLTGCMLGPDYLRPAFDAPESWRVSVPIADEILDNKWWKQFNDPALDSLVDIALEENKDLKLAVLRVEEYAAYLGVSEAGLYPQIDVGADARHYQNIPSGARNRTRYDAYSLAFSGSWELDLWGRIRRQNEAARAQLVGSEEGRNGVTLSLISAVVSSYINLRNLDRQLEISINTAKTREASYDIFKQRYEGGIISILELNQNKSQYDDALATIPLLEKTIAQQENALSLLLGRNPGSIERGKNIDELVIPRTLALLPSKLIERRPDILAAEQQLIAANAMIGAAKAAYFPRIALTGIDGFANSELSQLLKSRSAIWNYGVEISAPIFNAGRIAGQVAVSEAQQKQALINYQKTIQNAFSEVNDALIDQEKTYRQRSVQKEQIAALKAYSETARLRYDNGYTSYIEVLDAERSLYNAQLQYTQTQQRLLLASVNLYKAMGGGWQDLQPVKD